MKKILFALTLISSVTIYSCGSKDPGDNNNSSESSTESSIESSTEAPSDTTNDSGEDETNYGNGSTRTSGNSGH